MFAVANIVLPVFALIIAGYLLRWRNILGSNACKELNRFVVFLALPALMINILVDSSWSELYQPGFLCAFELGVFVIFFIVLAIHWLRTKSLVSATIDATSASYANTGYIGIPLCALTFGADKLAENYDVLMNAIIKAKPAAAKGQYIKGVSISTTMGPGLHINQK